MRIPARCAAITFSLMPPTGSTYRRRGGGAAAIRDLWRERPAGSVARCARAAVIRDLRLRSGICGCDPGSAAVIRDLSPGPSE